MNDCFWDCAKALAALEIGNTEEAKRILAEAIDREAPTAQAPNVKAA